MTIVFSVLYLVVLLFQFALIIRLVYDFVQMFARSWRPRGIALVLASVVYGITDPPLLRLRRFIRPLRIGGMSIDLAFLVLWLVTSLLLSFLGRLA